MNYMHLSLLRLHLPDKGFKFSTNSLNGKEQEQLKILRSISVSMPYWKNAGKWLINIQKSKPIHVCVHSLNRLCKHSLILIGMQVLLLSRVIAHMYRFKHNACTVLKAFGTES